MLRIFLLLWLPALIYGSENLRVMTFNIWMSAANVDNGLEKVAKHISHINPDVVTIQEDYAEICGKLLELLGPPWKGIQSNISPPDLAILTRHKIFNESFIFTNHLSGVRIEINNSYSIHLVSAHLDHANYGPYAPYDNPIKTTEQILDQEKSRLQNLEQFFKLEEMQKWLSMTEKIPFLLCGDFNAPSHLDWQENMKHEHKGWVLNWPTSKFMLQHEFSDSFRMIHPNITEEPGRSWSTVNKFNNNLGVPEPQDRIDFIYYRGPKLKPKASFLYKGEQPLKAIPNHRQNDFPSDHHALVSDFSIQIG